MRGRFSVVSLFWKIIRFGAFKIRTSCCRQSATIAISIDSSWGRSSFCAKIITHFCVSL